MHQILHDADGRDSLKRKRRPVSLSTSFVVPCYSSAAIYIFFAAFVTIANGSDGEHVRIDDVAREYYPPTQIRRQLPSVIFR